MASIDGGDKKVYISNVGIIHSERGFKRECEY